METAVKERNAQLAQLNFSTLGCWITLLAIVLILTSAGWGWLANGLLAAIAIVFLLPAIAWVGLRWWLRRNLIEDGCPVCQYEFTAFNGTMTRCPNCSEPLKVENRSFKRLTPAGTIDVDAVEVSPPQIED